MKRCRTCSRLYEDDTLNFCLDDGSLLSTVQESQETLILDTPYPNQDQIEALNSDSKLFQPKSKISADITKPQSKRMWLLGIIGVIVIAFISSLLTFTIMSGQKWSETTNTGTNTSPANTPIVTGSPNVPSVKIEGSPIPTRSPTPKTEPTSAPSPTPLPTYPNVVRTADGGLRPANGYRWVNPKDPEDYRVELKPGLIKTEDGQFQPANGYRWVNPKDQGDLRVERIARRQ